MGEQTSQIKKIVYILPDKDAGVASVVRNLLKFKTNRLATKVILLHNVLDDNSRRVKDDFNADDIMRLTYNGKWSSKATICKKIIKEIDVNSIVVSNDGGIEIDALARLKFSVPLVYIFHGDFKHYYNVLEKKQDFISKVITVSDFLKDNLESRYSTDIESVKFPVPNAVSIDRFYDEILRLIFVGSLSDRKGVMSLYEISKNLERRDISYKLTIVGAGVKEKELKHVFKGNDKVSFLGSVNNKDVFKEYLNHDIILLPSEAEGLPVVLVEAMKHGVVPMATDLESGIPELITHGFNGYTLKLNDFKGYANYIEGLHTDRILLKTMSERCVTIAKTKFDPFEQTKAYEDAFLDAKPKFSNRKTSILDYLPMTIAHRLKSYM